MPKYDVTFKWEKYISFGIIEAKNRKEAQEIAEDRLDSDKSLLEEDDKTKWEIEKEVKKMRPKRKKNTNSKPKKRYVLQWEASLGDPVEICESLEDAKVKITELFTDREITTEEDINVYELGKEMKVKINTVIIKE